MNELISYPLNEDSKLALLEPLPPIFHRSKHAPESKIVLSRFSSYRQKEQESFKEDKTEGHANFRHTGKSSNIQIGNFGYASADGDFDLCFSIRDDPYLFCMHSIFSDEDHMDQYGSKYYVYIEKFFELLQTIGPVFLKKIIYCDSPSITGWNQNLQQYSKNHEDISIGGCTYLKPKIHACECEYRLILSYKITTQNDQNLAVKEENNKLYISGSALSNCFKKI